MASGDEAKYLQQALELTHRDEQDPTVSENIAIDIKRSLSVQCNPEDFVASASAAVPSVSALFIAAGSNDAAQLNLQLTGEHDFRAQNLAVCLTECGRYGMNAFMEAEKGTAEGVMYISKMLQTMNDAIEMLMDPSTASVLLKRTAQSSIESSRGCFEKFYNMDTTLDTWLKNTYVLHSALVQKTESADGKKAAEEISKAMAAVRFKSAKDSAAAGTVTQQTEKRLNEATEALLKATEGFPTGWNLLGQQMSGDLANGFNIALNQGISSLLDVSLPSIQAERLQNIQVEGSKDPAYSQIAKDFTFLELLNRTLNTNQKTTEVKEAADLVKTNLSRSQAEFKTIAQSTAPSQTYQSILETSIKVATGLANEIGKAGCVDPDGEAVKALQNDFKSIYLSAVKLNSQAKVFPGVPTRKIPLISSWEFDGKLDPKSSQALAVLGATTDNFETLLRTYSAAGEISDSASQLLNDKQKSLAEINANMFDLMKGRIKLQQITQLVQQSIKTIIAFKEHIVTLVRYFDAISKSFELLTRTTIEPYANAAKALSRGESDGKAKLGPISLTDIRRSNCYHGLLILQGYIGATRDMVSLYSRASQDSIFLGVRMAEQLSMMGPAAGGMVPKLQDFSKRSQESFQRDFGDKRRQTSDDKQRKLNDAREQAGRVPTSDEAKKAIEDGANAVKRSIIAGLEQRAKESLLVKLK